MTQKDINELSFKVIGVAIEVHKIVGRGLLESVYHECMKEPIIFKKYRFYFRIKGSCYL